MPGKHSRTKFARLGTVLSLALVAGVPLVATSCGAQGGRTIMTQGANAEPIMGTAPEAGTYKLYTAFSPNPTTTVNLKQGDQLGFRRDDNGQLVAVAGDQTQPLAKGTSQAYWKLEK
ncbi:MAG TPA: hypothetical protein VLI90_12080 [Tepidisphaeraceae bacterium]|nr:hypothetical protein [Tepidisphaeraceae bacterium]